MTGLRHFTTGLTKLCALHMLIVKMQNKKSFADGALALLINQIYSLHFRVLKAQTNLPVSLFEQQ